FQRIGKCLVPPRTEPLAPQDDRDPRDWPNRHPAGRTDPAVVECIFQEIRDADQHRCDPDAIQPVRTYARLEIGVFLRWRCDYEGWRRRPRRWRNWRRWLDTLSTFWSWGLSCSRRDSQQGFQTVDARSQFANLPHQLIKFWL